ncbi:MAG: LuxR C-terminal-related transcriptional regulator [Cyanobacteria bacterium P01_G01_bin.67]
MVFHNLLETKFFIPSRKSNLVLRDRLNQEMCRGVQHKLTLLSAPPGFGKTTLLAQWIKETELKCTWLSLDHQDNDLIRFWQYTICAMQKVQAQLGNKTLEIISDRHNLDYDYFLTPLIAELSTITNDIVLILDDYHSIQTTTIHQSLKFLLEYLPPYLHLIIASRSDLPFPLARLRARGEMTELRAKELRFTMSETQDFAQEVMHLDLSLLQIKALQAKAEGWIAGLQMAGLSLQKSTQKDVWINSLQGNQRYIADYLIEEILEQQPNELKAFLIKTSILERMCGSLCDTVLQIDNSTEILTNIERINLFIVSLDENCHWYRYHHLFRELLLHNLQKREPQQIPRCHLRAAKWYREQNLIDEAFNHALLAQEWEFGADLIEQEACQLIVDADINTLLDRLQALPNQIICDRPWLCVYYAWSLWFALGDIKGAKQYLADAEQAAKISPLPETKASWTNHPLSSEVKEFWANIAVLNSYLSHEQDVKTAIDLAESALKIVPQYNYWLRSLVLTNLGFSYYLGDRFKQAEQALIKATQASTDCQQATKVESKFINRTVDSAVSSLCLRAELNNLHGEPEIAIALCQSALEIVTRRHWTENVGGILAQAVMGKLLWQQNKLESATYHLTQGNDRSSSIKTSGFTTIRHLYLALIYQAQGDFTTAWESVATAEQIERSRQQGFSFEFPTFLALDLVKVRLWLAQGNIDKAVAWIQSQELSINDKLTYDLEPSYITLARILIIQEKWQQALYLLQRLEKFTESSQRISRLIEVLILQTIVYQAQNRIDLALKQLERLFSLSHPQFYLRYWLDAAPSMSQLLNCAAKESIYPSYIKYLQSNLGEIKSEPKTQDLINPLSDRELEILHHIAMGMSNKEISQKLFISLATVKWHSSNIYGKLSVKNRNQAVVEARKLNILR